MRFIFKPLLVVLLILQSCTSPNQKTQESCKVDDSTECKVDTIEKIKQQVTDSLVVNEPIKDFHPDSLFPAIISNKSGYLLRNSPINSDTTSNHLRFGRGVYIKDILQRDTINGHIDNWYEVVIDPNYKNWEKGFVFGADLYADKKEFSLEVLQNLCLISEYPELEAKGGENNELFLKLANGDYATIKLSGDCQVMFAGWYPQISSYLFDGSCYGEYDLCYFLNFNTGESTSMLDLPSFNSSGEAWFVQSYATYEGQMNSLQVYDAKDSGIVKSASFPLLDRHRQAVWQTNDSITIEFNSSYSSTHEDKGRKFVTSVSKQGGSWVAMPSLKDLFSVTNLLDFLFEFSCKDAHIPKDLYAEGLGKMEISEQKIEYHDDNGQFHSNSLLDYVSTDSVIDPQKLTRFFNVGLQLDERGYFSLQDFYKHYADMLKAYCGIYENMHNVVGEEQLLKDYQQALSDFGKLEYGMLIFYKNYLLKHKLTEGNDHTQRDGLYVAVGFWLRRMNDGSAETCYALLGELFKMYDPEFYKYYY